MLVSANFTIDDLDESIVLYGESLGAENVHAKNLGSHTSSAQSFGSDGPTIFLNCNDFIEKNFFHRIGFEEKPWVIDAIDKNFDDLSFALSELASHKSVLFYHYGSLFYDVPPIPNYITFCHHYLERLSNLFDAYPMLVPINLADTVRDLDIITGRRFLEINDFPFGQKDLAKILGEAALQYRNRSVLKKVLLLDCDNTLWSGVVGDLGPNGLKFDENTFPHSMFQKFHTVIGELIQNGVLVCVVSKNTIENVQEVFRRPDFPLSEKDIISWKVNWSPKSENIREISQELDLSLDSFVFVDDSDSECFEISENLPEIQVLQVPKKLSDFPIIFNQLRQFFMPNFFLDGGNSNLAKYRVRAEYKSEERSARNRSEFLENLETRISIRMSDKADFSRAVQLSAKSNQFNMMTRRFTENSLETYLAEGGDFWAIQMSDRFGDHGVISLIFGYLEKETLVIDNFLISCRVLGRELEFAIWAYLLDSMPEISSIRAEAKETEKNKNFVNFYADLGLKIQPSDGNHHLLYCSEDIDTIRANCSRSWIKNDH